MDKYLNISKPVALQTKKKHVEKDPHQRDTEAMKRMTERERIMHIATTATTSGHDIWQSASTGHQVSEAGGKSVSYNDARLAKLQAQFPPQQKAVKRPRADSSEQQRTGRDSSHISLFDYDATSNLYHPSQVSASQTYRNVGSGIFGGCVFYLDGYMGPKMSDHTLRRILTQNGGTLSMYLKKTRITHVLLSDSGALANSKIRKEVEGSRNRVKFVKVEWVHKCLEVGKRIGEWEYSIDRLRGKNQTVASMLQNSTNATSKNFMMDKDRSDSAFKATKLSKSLSQDRFEEKQLSGLLDAEEGERIDALDR